MMILFIMIVLISDILGTYAFQIQNTRQIIKINDVNIRSLTPMRRSNELKMNFFSDAARFFLNMKKEASAKHILIKGPGADSKLAQLKDEINNAENISEAFSTIASKVSECPSATRGGALGTFKPGMMVAEFDKVVFEEEVGKVHGPIKTQFGSHLILITRRYEGEEKPDSKK